MSVKVSISSRAYACIKMGFNFLVTKVVSIAGLWNECLNWTDHDVNDKQSQYVDT